MKTVFFCLSIFKALILADRVYVGAVFAVHVKTFAGKHCLVLCMCAVCEFVCTGSCGDDPYILMVT